MPRSGSIKKQAMAGDANDALPRDVLASVLLRFPASDLRRFRLVCKEWCEVISDPTFIDAHMVHGPRALTHTIVFFRGRRGGGADGAIEPRSSDGYLFDEQWRLVARFTAGESEDMVGTCNGLLCFLDLRQGGIRVVEPFTGESLVLPSPQRRLWHARGAYSFGFDPSSRRYKILHHEKDAYMYTIGGGEKWRRAHGATVSYGCVFADGAVWSVATNRRRLRKVVRFDLATEKITSEPMESAGWGTALSTVSDARVFLMGLGVAGELEVFSMGDGGRWMRYSIAVRAPHMRFPAVPHPLQRGHVLMRDRNRDSRGGVYAHPIAPASNDLGSGKLLLQMPKDWPGADGTPRCDNKTRWLFVPVPREEETAARVRRVPQELHPPRVFSYAPPVSIFKKAKNAPPVSPPPLARYFGGLREL
ncbi:hypothetical protein CFC21_009801 [Triticum aestivum]|uniref:F-box domain-containing protein n=2 Tax=Triticum aestivum TaxID=4565 RepID=A0A9R1DJH7_WHEAT|nr:hypothetical protein CFC21_009801 [Triticum aestivum]